MLRNACHIVSTQGNSGGHSATEPTAAAVALNPAWALPQINEAVPTSIKIKSDSNFWRKAAVTLLEREVILDEDCAGAGSIATVIERCLLRLMGPSVGGVINGLILVSKSADDYWFGQQDYWEDSGHDPFEAALYLAVFTPDTGTRLLQPVMEPMATKFPELAETIMATLCGAQFSVPHFWTPSLALDLASHLYWEGEDSEEGGVESYGLSADEVVRRSDFASIPEWALNPKVKLASSQIRGIGAEAPAYQAVCDALLLVMELLSEGADLFCYLGDGCMEGLVLRWNQSDVVMRVFDDRANSTYQNSDCYTELIGLRRIPLADPLPALEAFSKGAKLVAVVGRLIELISVEGVGDGAES